MASFENRIVATLLNVMRTRRQEHTSCANDMRSDPLGHLAPAKLREARFSDFEGVADLKKRGGLAVDSLENWERLWRKNPAFEYVSGERPVGWVLEADGKIVGYMGNISQLYRYGDRTLTSVTAHGLVVDPPYRSLVVSLVGSYFRQKGVDIFVSTGEIAPVGKIGRIFKSEPLPLEDYEAVLFWVLQPHAFVKAILRKLRIGRISSYLGGMIGALVLRADRTLRRRWPRGSSTGFHVSEIKINEIGSEFSNLWMDKVNEKLQLLAERNPAVLRWHFEVPGDKGSVRVLCCRKNGELLGYAIVRNEAADETGLRRSMIADMLVKGDSIAVMETLLIAACRHAQKEGSHILEVFGFPPRVRRVWARWHPYIRKYPTPLFAYKAADPILQKAISEGETWYASPFDGDFTLIRPSYSSSNHQPANPGAPFETAFVAGQHTE